MEVTGTIKVRGKKVHYDKKVCNGLYFVNSKKNLKKNLKKFNIINTIPSSTENVATNFNKRGSVMFVSHLVYIDDYFYQAQFLIKKNCKKEDLLNCGYEDFIKKDLLHAYEVLNTETFGELLDLNENYNNN